MMHMFVCYFILSSRSECHLFAFLGTMPLYLCASLQFSSFILCFCVFPAGIILRLFRPCDCDYILPGPIPNTCMPSAYYSLIAFLVMESFAWLLTVFAMVKIMACPKLTGQPDRVLFSRVCFYGKSLQLATICMTVSPQQGGFWHHISISSFYSASVCCNVFFVFFALALTVLCFALSCIFSVSSAPFLFCSEANPSPFRFVKI